MESGNSKKKISSKLIIIVCVVILIGVVIIWSVINKNKNIDTIQQDPNVIVGTLSKEDVKKKMEDMQKRVDEGMLNVNMITNPQFENGNSEGKINIENTDKNTKSFTVKIILEDSKEVVYSSGLIPPGSYVEKIKLSKKLSKGSYPSIAYFTTFNKEGKPDGQVGLNVTLHILN